MAQSNMSVFKLFSGLDFGCKPRVGIPYLRNTMVRHQASQFHSFSHIVNITDENLGTYIFYMPPGKEASMWRLWMPIFGVTTTKYSWRSSLYTIFGYKCLVGTPEHLLCLTSIYNFYNLSLKLSIFICHIISGSQRLSSSF